ncbi:MAG: AAA family ATPase [Chloroflexi bacterium]|nr:AAA family ATPase [Chloroflexota bacterium]
MAALALDIRLLGPLEILVDGHPMIVDTRKAVAILVLLATDGRAYARGELAALLWPDADETSARGALRRTISTLRAAVGDGVLSVDRMNVDLVRSRVRVDIGELEVATTSDSLDELVRAAVLIRGRFLAGFTLRDSPDFDDWCAGRAMRVERHVAELLDRLSIAQGGAGDLAGAIHTATMRIELDSLDEGAHVRLMELLAANGDRTGALRQYRACVATLERELGVSPLPETTGRYEAIRDAVVAPPRHADEGNPAVQGPRLPMVARDDALAVMERARETATVDGRSILVIGEAGIGKTRLAEAAIAVAGEAGGAVLSARAYATERAIPYGPIVELLRTGLAKSANPASAFGPGIVAEIGRLLPGVEGGRRQPRLTHEGPVAQSRLVSAIADALTALVAGPSVGIVWIDDIQWADTATLEALAYLARRLAGRPLALILTWRPEDLDGDALALAEQLEHALTTVRIDLERFDRGAVRVLVAAASGQWRLEAAVIDELMRVSEGLPLYLVEALAAGPLGDGRVPRGVRAVLRQRLAVLDGVSAQIIAAAAAIGRSFDLATVRHASGRTEDETIVALDELVRCGMIREATAESPADIRYDFVHGALRDVVEEMTSLARSRLLHRRIAEALRRDLADQGRDDLGRLVQIAQHEQTSGRNAEAAEAFATAGDGAAAVFANREAVGHYAAAIALGHPDLVLLHASIGELHARLGDYAGAIVSLEAAAALAATAHLDDLELKLARIHLRRGDLVAADRHLDVALAATNDDRLRARALVSRAIVLRRAGDFAGAAEAASDAHAAALAGDDLSVLGSANRMVGLTALDQDDPARARASLEAALRAAADDPDPTAAVAALVGLAMADGALGLLDALGEHGEAALLASRRIGDRHLEAAVENHLADLLHAAGRNEAAMEHQRRAVVLFAELAGDPTDPDPGIWMLSAW